MPVSARDSTPAVSPLGVFGLGPDELRDLARLRRVRDRIDREYAQPLGDQTDQESRSAGHRGTPSVTARTVLHPVSDLATAKAVYAAPLPRSASSRADEGEPDVLLETG